MLAGVYPGQAPPGAYGTLLGSSPVGPLYPTSIVDIGNGSYPFTSPESLYVPDGNAASTFDLNLGSFSNYLRLRFGFAIPANATILGLMVEARAMDGGTSTHNAISFRLWDGAALIGDVANFLVTNAWAWYVAGGLGALWNASLTPALLNSNFAVTLRTFNNSGGIWQTLVDALRVTVWYQVAVTITRVIALTQAQAAPALTVQDLRTLTPTQAQAAATVRQARRNLVPTQAQAAAMLRQARRNLVPTQAQAAAMLRQARRSVAPTQAQTPALTTTDLRILVPTQAQAAATVRQVRRSVAPSQAQSVRSAAATPLILGLLQSAAATRAARISVTVATQQTALAALPARSAARTLSATQLASVRIVGRLARTFLATGASSAAVARTVFATHAATQVAGIQFRLALGRALTLTQDAMALLERASSVQTITVTTMQDQGVGSSAAVTRSFTVSEAALASRQVTILRGRILAQPQIVRLVRVIRRTRSATQMHLTLRRVTVRRVWSVADGQTVSAEASVRIVRVTQLPGTATVIRAIPALFTLAQDQRAVLVLPLGPPGELTISDRLSTRVELADFAMTLQGAAT